MVKHTTTKTKSNHKQLDDSGPMISTLNTKIWPDKPAKFQSKQRGLTVMLKDIVTEYTKEANGILEKIPKNTAELTKMKNMKKEIQSTVEQVKQAKENLSQKVTTVQKDFLKCFDSFDHHLSRLFEVIDETEHSINDLRKKSVNQWNNEGQQLTQELTHKVHTMIHSHK